MATLEHHHFSTEKYIPLVACAHEIAQIAADWLKKIDIEKTRTIW